MESINISYDNKTYFVYDDKHSIVVETKTPSKILFTINKKVLFDLDIDLTSSKSIKAICDLTSSKSIKAICELINNFIRIYTIGFKKGRVHGKLELQQKFQDLMSMSKTVQEG